MARNRRPEAEARDGSSSEEEEEESSEEIEESESESEEEEEKDKAPAPSIKKPLPSRLKKPETAQPSTQRKISSSDEWESESASESDSRNPNVKTLASKAMEEPPKPRSKPSLVTPVVKSTKRPVESENKNNRESKRVKKRPEEDAYRALAEEDTAKTGDDSKKQLFQRLWSDEDEIAILKGMAEYKEKKGIDPATEMNAFHDFIKKSLHIEVSKVQLSDKVRRLKKKFENNSKKSHEQSVYEWSKKIWGGGGGGGDDANANGGVVETTKLVDGKADKKIQTKMAVEANSVSITSIFDKLGLDDDDIVKDVLGLISESKRIELEEKWSKFRIQAIEIYLMRLDLIKEKVKLVLEALKSSGN